MSKRPTIYYWCPDYSSAVGGVKVMYRHVDILNRNGFNACILHRKKGFRCTWFENSTRVSYIKKTRPVSSDFLVIPEVYGSLYANPNERPKASRLFFELFNTPAKKVIFNQNTYNTFSGHDFEGDRPHIYTDKDVLAAMVVSDDNRGYLEHAFDGIRIYRMHNTINHDMFSFRSEKRPQICFMPRKNADHALQVINILRNRGTFDDFGIIPIEGRSEIETASIMKESLIFLSFGYPEGFSLPPAEAMACGCIVIGYHGMGGREYFKEEYCYTVEMGDIVSFARTVEGVIATYRDNPDTLKIKAESASAYVIKNYSMEREEADLLYCWNELMG